MENKLRINISEENLYRINISDNGDEIVLNLTDISLPLKINDLYKKIEKNIDILKQKLLLLDKNKDLSKDGFATKYQMEVIKTYNEFYQENRKLFDELFGEGTMQILFGNTNYMEMYDDLFKELEPHFKKMNLKGLDIIERIKNKYKAKDEDVIMVS